MIEKILRYWRGASCPSPFPRVTLHGNNHLAEVSPSSCIPNVLASHLLTQEPDLGNLLPKNLSNIASPQAMCPMLGVGAGSLSG